MSDNIQQYKNLEKILDSIGSSKSHPKLWNRVCEELNELWNDMSQEEKEQVEDTNGN